MTGPIPAGFPDWGRQVADANVLEINDVGVVKNGAVSYPVRYIGNAKALFVVANPGTVANRFRVDFYADGGGLEILGSYSIDCQVADQAYQPVPVLSPYMGATVLPGGAGNYTYTFLVWRTPEMGNLAGADVGLVVGSFLNRAIAASTTEVLGLNRVQEGPVSWNAFPTSTNWEARLQVVDYLGNVTVLDRIGAGVPQRDVRHVYVPPMTLQTYMQNADAAPKTYDFFVSRPHNLS